MLIVCALVGGASAEAWRTSRGLLERGRIAGSYLLTSDAAPGRYSEATMISIEPVALPYTVTATWRRLGPEAGRSMHVLVGGGVVLIKSGAIALYAYDDAAFAQGDWRPIAAQTQADHVVSVHQDARSVTVSIDGAAVAHYDLATTRETAHVGFGMKSAPGLRSSIYVRAIAIAPAQSQ
ncbi:hypothetical protein BH11MYX3_BH11MYX3_36870 [soil metagenome]